MPATFTPRTTHPELDRKDPGFGGRPPVKDRPTGGGGDGDNGDDWLRGRGPGELLRQCRLGLSFALAGDLVFFLSLVSAFFVRQTGGHFDAADNYIADWRPSALPSALWFATAFLLASSLTVECARRQLFREIDVIEEWLGLGRPMATRTWPWLGATAGLGLGYVVSIGYAWHQMSHAGVHFASSPDSAFVFILTGTHAVHIVSGLVLLLVAAFGLYRLRRVEQRQILADCIAWFWHAMAGFWLLLFALLLGTR